MDKKFVESFAFFGKIGADNALLILIGVEHIILFALKYSEGKHYKRLWLYLYEGAFFIGYGFFNDIYRVKSIRPWLLSWSYNFAYVNSFAILIFGIPLLIRISLDIQNIIIERRKTRYVHRHTDTQTRKIDAQKVFEAIMKAATGTIKVMTSTLEAAKTVALITYDVLETLKENGVIVEPTPQPETLATNTREISAESKIAHMACQIVMSGLLEEVEVIEPAEPVLDIDLTYANEGESAEEGIEDAPKKRGKK